MSYKLYIVSGVTRLDTINADGVTICRVTRLTPVEVVHGERRVTGYLIETLSIRHSLLHSILIVENLITANYRLHTTS